MIGNDAEGMRMKWLEIIELRAIYLDQDGLQQQIDHLMEEIKKEHAMMIYANARVETDWRIHVPHESEIVNAHGSELGQQLKMLLQEFGLVSHTIWCEKAI